ncbi:murein biosynthesis integral membrane protein MurJ [Georgenia yuyongxinii]|uniref:murein biosynthesis integral membrane protein MurJ n=1 Tax=Georgenia yuyongxinii TaxID=2589797 RepID=UPI0022AAEEA2|nr:murein biosynthesis integral membrane protein MurJ [Georgenia yuyongxinii]
MDQSRSRGLAGSSAVMFAGTLVSRLLGVVRSPLLIGAAIGINYGAANSFFVANKLPNIIYMLIAGGVLNAVLVPQIVRALKQHDDGGQAYVNRLVTLAVVGLAAVTALLTAGAPVLVSIFADTLAPQWYDLAVAFGYWCIPQVFFYGMYTVLGQILNARGIFGPYMWAPVLNNVVAIAGLVLYLAVFGGVGTTDPNDAAVWTAGRVALLAGTATLGVASQALVLIVPLRRAGFRYRPDLTLRGSGLGRASRMAMWVFATLTAGQVSTVVISRAAARATDISNNALDVAGNAAYDTAYLVYSLPISLVVVSLVTALFTRMAGNAAGKDLTAVRADLSLGLRTVGVFTVFAAGGLMVLALPVVRVITGTVSYTEAQSVARVVVAMLAGLVGVGAFTVVQRVYYAFEDARRLFWLQLPMIAIVAAGAGAAMLLPPEWTVVGIGAAMSLSNTVGAAVTYLALRGHLPSLDGGRVLRTHLRLLLAATPATLLGWGLLHLLGTSSDDLSVLGALWRTVVVGGVMLVTYVALLRLLRVDELSTIARPVGRMVAAAGRRVPGPPGTLLVRFGHLIGGVRPPGRGSADGPDPDDDGPGGGGPDGGPAGPGGGGPDGPLDPDGGPDSMTTEEPAPLRTLGPNRHHGADVRPGEGGGTVLDAESEHVGTDRMLGGRYAIHGSPLRARAGAVEWRAHDTILDREVQVLLLPPDGRHNALVLDAARRAALVEDHRLLRVLDVDDEDARPHVVTEKVRGSDLGTLSRRGGLPPAQARAVVGEAASALESARRHGVHHLALTPESIVISDDGHVLVTGLATDAALVGAGEDDESPLATTRQDAVDLVRLLYLAFTGTWPEPPGGEPPAPVDELRPGVPQDLAELCAATLADGGGPHSTGELIRLLAPWPDVDPALMPGPVPPPPPPPAPPHTSPGQAHTEVPAPPHTETDDRSATTTATDGPRTVLPHASAGERPVPAPVPPPGAPPLHWAPHRPSTTDAPEFSTILDDDPETYRPGLTDTLTGLTAVASDAARTAATSVASGTRRVVSRTKGVTSGARRLADGASAAAGSAGKGLGSTLSAGRERLGATWGERGAPGAGAADDQRRPVASEVDGPEVPFKERRMDPTPVVLVGVGLLVLVLLFVAMRILFAPPAPVSLPEPSAAATPTTSAAPSPAPSTAAPATVAPVVASLVPVDPQGDGAENPTLTPLALDGDTATWWRSRSYVNPAYGMKEGIGLAVSLAQRTQVSRVEIDLHGTGGLVQVRSTTPGAPTGGPVLAEGEMGPGTVLTFTEPVETDSLVLWFPRLPVADSDGKNRIELSELRLG